MLDAAMNFAVNAGLTGRDRPRATLDLKSELLLPASTGSTYAVRGQVVRMARQVAFVEAAVRDDGGRLVSRATATFLLSRES
jgi:acyl-coenzyme A thioesterase PaaI-like protein